MKTPSSNNNSNPMKTTKTSRFSKPSRILVASIAACAVLGLASPASAQTHYWSGTAPNFSWSNDANWATGAGGATTVPGNGATVRFELSLAQATLPGNPIIMDKNYNGLLGNPTLGFVRFTGNEIVSIENYLKITSTTTALQLANGSGGPAKVSVPAAGTIDGTINLANEGSRPHPVLDFTGGSWVAGNVKTESSGRQGGTIKVSSSTGTLTPGAVLVSLAPEVVANRARFHFVLSGAGATAVAPIAFSAGSNPLNFTGNAAGTNPFTLTVDTAGYSGATVDIPLITHASDTDRLFSADSITIGTLAAEKGAFVTQTDTGTTVTLTGGGDWSGTNPTSWGTDGVGGNWSDGTAPGTLARAIANFPTAAVNDKFTVTLDGTSPTLAVLNINSGTLAAKSYSIGQGTSGNINLGATPTGSAFAAAQINVLKGTNNTISAPVALNMDALVNTAAGTKLTMSGVISGAFSLTKGSSGELVLSGGANSYTGATIIPAGTLSFSTLANAGANSDLGNYPTAGAAGIVLNSSTTLNYTGSTASVDRGFTAAGSNSISIATINVATANQTLTLGDSAINIPSGGYASMRFTGGSGSKLVLGAVTSSVNGEVWLEPTTTNLTLASFTGAGVTRLDLGGSTHGNAITGDINILGTTDIRKRGTGTWTLSGNNPIPGKVHIDGGTLVVTNPLSLGNKAGNGSESAVWLDGTLRLLNDTSTNFVKNVYLPNNGEPTIHVGKAVGGTGSNQTHTLGDVTYNAGNLNWNFSGDSGYGLTLGNVKGHRITNNLGAPGILTLASLSFVNTGDDSVIQGTGNTLITGAVTGPGPSALSKEGTGTLTLQGVNTYTAMTTVSEGTLALVGGSQSSPITVNNNAFLAFDVAAPTTSTSTYNFIAGSKVKIIGTPTLPSYTLTTSTGISGISGNANLDVQIPGYDLVLEGTSLKLVQPSGYVTWAATNAGGQAANLDHNNDGVQNGVAYFMNLIGFGTNPVVNPVNKVITWPNGGNILHTAYGTEFVVQTSTDLTNPLAWTDVLISDPNLDNNAGGVSYTLTGTGPLFVRLKVIIP